MKFNVAQLLKERTGSKRKYEINASIHDEESGGSCAVTGDVSLLFTGVSILVQGNVNVDSGTVCSRCLVDFRYVIQFSIDEEYLPINDTRTRLEVDSQHADGFMIDQTHTLDLTEAVRQYSITNSPMNPVCKPDCLGICGNCGIDLNKVRCKCVSSSGALSLSIRR